MHERKGALMRGEPRKEDLINIPNVLCYIRILLVPVFVILFLKEMYWQSGIVIMIATATDVVDGWIARHFNMITDWGKFIDPLADKLMQFAMLIMAIFKNPWISILVAIFAIKEAVMLAVGLYIYHKGNNLNGAMWCGKLATVVLDACLFLLIILPTKYTRHSNVFILIALSAGFLILSFVIYMREYFKMYKEMKADGTIQPKEKQNNK